jgi:predicted dehydrogenase
VEAEEGSCRRRGTEVVDSHLNRWFWETDVEDNCNVALKCGVTDVSVDVSLTSWKNQFGIEVYGTDGLVLISGRGGNYGSQKIEYVNRWFWRGEDKRQQHDYGTNDPSFENETKAFFAKIEGGRAEDCLSTEDDGVAVLKLVEELYARAAH